VGIKLQSIDVPSMDYRRDKGLICISFAFIMRHHPKKTPRNGQDFFSGFLVPVEAGLKTTVCESP